MASISPWNWPLSWRIVVLLNISFYNLTGNAFAAGIAPLIGDIVEDLHVTVEQASVLAGYALLSLGLANIYALPLCAYIGKRYTILITMTIYLGVLIWAAQVRSYNSLVGTRVVGGLAAGVVEAMGPFIVSETFPEHQLSRAMVTYVGFLAGGSTIGPIFSGIIVTHLGDWRWFFWILAIAVGANLICSVIMLPETSYAGEWEFKDIDIDELQREAENKLAVDSVEYVDNAELQAAVTDNSQANASLSKLSLWKERSFFLPWHMEDISRPAGIRFGFISLIIAPFPLLLIPSVFVSTLLFGLSVGWLVVYSVLSANVFLAPPYLWSAQSTGLLPASSLIGILIGLPVGGLLADKLSIWQAKRSNGEHNPRSRLPLVVAGFLISPTGLLISGYCLRPEHTSWVGFSFGWGMLAFGITASSTVITTYCVDTFRNKASHIGVLLNVIKNCIGFGVSYATVPWHAKYTPVQQFGTMAGLLWAGYLAVIPLYLYHKRLTEFSNRWIERVERRST